jgi:4-deoxy-L-threo-5-hexosulose-uronate ketol-isomerase
LVDIKFNITFTPSIYIFFYMKTTIEERWGTHPNDVKRYDTKQLRNEFVVDRLFAADEALMVYTHNDRLIIGGAWPVNEAIHLETVALIRSEYFCERREAGIICIENEGLVVVDGTEYPMSYKDALYVGRGSKEVIFKSLDAVKPAKFYFASSPAHTAYPTAAITREMRRTRELGVKALSNERTLNQLILNEIVPCCQLQMGLTEIKEGSVWNTMPPHTHSRRMEAYFYFKVPEEQAVCHFMGQPQETRHLFLANEQAVISPSWSIHSAAGTSNYTFIWAMCGENLAYDDMDTFTADKLR